ncbi:glycosyltransferase [Streptosporangium lutulentum]
MIQAVGVVIPARDEEDLLPSCLAAVDLAARLITGTAVHLIVVADTCNDRTAALAARAGATVVEGSMANVGRARLAGAEELLRRTRALDPATVWLATTDADTLVPPCWLSRQLKHARHGWEAVVGTVTVTDWAGYSPRYQAVYTERYAAGTEAPGAETARTEIAGVEAARTEAGVEASWTEAAGVETARVETGGTARRHPHVHGANLGVTAAAYLAVGGSARCGPVRTTRWSVPWNRRGDGSCAPPTWPW